MAMCHRALLGGTGCSLPPRFSGDRASAGAKQKYCALGRRLPSSHARLPLTRPSVILKSVSWFEYTGTISMPGACRQKEYVPLARGLPALVTLMERCCGCGWCCSEPVVDRRRRGVVPPPPPAADWCRGLPPP